MLTILALLGVAAVLFGAAVLSTRDGAVLADAPRDAADVPLPDEPLTPEDVGNLRFSLAARGYRMSEVDLALERLARELADRDRRIALLEAAAEGNETPPAVREATVEDLPAAPAPIAAPIAPAPVAPTPPAPVAPTPPAPIAAPIAPAPVPPAPPQPEPTPTSTWAPTPPPQDPTDPASGFPPADLGTELLSNPPQDDRPHPA